MTTPTLINLPPPPSESVTPSDMGPGTPNSGTTSLSALSTTAIKDGHQGHNLPPGHRNHSLRNSGPSSTVLDAERADRISRLAGLERVTTVRPSQSSHLNPGPPSNPPPGYFDNTLTQVKDRSTVGSASATESVGGRTTWASGSVDYEGDKMSEDQDDGISSTGGMSDGNTSLVGFGEGAGSTMSAPISATMSQATNARQASASSPSANRDPRAPSQGHPGGNPMSYLSSPSVQGGDSNMEARMTDGMSYDVNMADTTIHHRSTSVNQGHPGGNLSAHHTDLVDSELHRAASNHLEQGTDKP